MMQLRDYSYFLSYQRLFSLSFKDLFILNSYIFARNKYSLTTNYLAGFKILAALINNN